MSATMLVDMLIAIAVLGGTIWMMLVVAIVWETWEAWQEGWRPSRRPPIARTRTHHPVPPRNYRGPCRQTVSGKHSDRSRYHHVCEREI